MNGKRRAESIDTVSARCRSGGLTRRSSRAEPRVALRRGWAFALLAMFAVPAVAAQAPDRVAAAPVAQRQAALAYLDAHQEEKAVVAARIAVGLFPDDGDAKAILAKALIRGGQYAQGLDIARSVSADAVARVGLEPVLRAAALASEAEQQLASVAGLTTVVAESRKAVALLERAVAVDADNLALKKALAWLYVDRLGEPLRASRHLAKVLAVRPTDLDALRMDALATSGRGRVASAVDRYKAVLAVDPSDRWMQISLAKALTWSGREGEAEEIYRSILLVQPGDVDSQLGLIEVLARRGSLRRAISEASGLVDREPRATQARTVLAELYRWDWQLAAAGRVLTSALEGDRESTAVKDGLRSLAQVVSPRVEPTTFAFTDSDQFKRTMQGASMRMPIGDRAAATGGFERWQFHVYDQAQSRADIKAGLEYHWGRRAEALFEAIAHTTQVATDVEWRASGKWVSPRRTVYVSQSVGTPVIDSFATVRDSLGQRATGVGIDLRLTDTWSVQGSVAVSRYDDGNVRRQWAPQVSYRLFQAPDVFARVQYDDLRFSESGRPYFAPSSFRTLRPIVEAQPRLGRSLSLLIKGEIPLLLETHRVGAALTAALLLNRDGRVGGEVAYLYANAPSLVVTGGQHPSWSGSGARASATVRF